MNRRSTLKVILPFVGILLAAATATAQQSPLADLQNLSSDFWTWRASEQPFSFDDIPRLDRPAGWAADWSAATVDYLLVGSAIARARWELDYVRGWQRNPYFYLDQTLASVFVSLTQPPPFDPARSAEIVRRIQAIPQIVADAEANLRDPYRPLAVLSINQLKDIRPRLEQIARELKPYLAPASAAQLDPATQAAIAAFEGYRGWLEPRLPAMSNTVAVGRQGYVFFLKHVALLPYTPEELTTMGRREWERAVAFEAYECNRNSALPQLVPAKDQAAQM